MPAPNDLPPAATAPQAIGGDVEVLRRLVEGTVRSTGEEFFRSLVRNLSLALGSPYALVAEFAGSPSRVRTLAYWGKGAFLVTTGLMLGDAIIFILCLNEHKGNRLVLTECKFQEMCHNCART